MTHQQILELVSVRLGVPAAEICGLKRSLQIVRARQLVAWLLYRHCMMSYTEVGAFLKRDHTTVMQEVRTVCRLLKDHPNDPFSRHASLLDQQVLNVKAEVSVTQEAIG